MATSAEMRARMIYLKSSAVGLVAVLIACFGLVAIIVIAAIFYSSRHPEGGSTPNDSVVRTCKRLSRGPGNLVLGSIHVEG